MIEMIEEKISEEEILSEDELENVAGGSKDETKDLLKLFGEVLMHKALFNKNLDIGKGDIRGFLNQAGIKTVLNDKDYPNGYSLGEKFITHEQALAHLRNHYGLN